MQKLTLETLVSKIEEYEGVLTEYLDVKGLRDLVPYKIDHIAVKLSDTSEYENFINDNLAFFASANYIQMNNRRITTVRLKNAIETTSFGSVFYLEIMEPKPEKVGTFKSGLDHAEIWVPNFDELEKEFGLRDLEFVRSDNGHHRTLIFKMNDLWEVKFTDKTIEDTVKDEIESGLITSLK